MGPRTAVLALRVVRDHAGRTADGRDGFARLGVAAGLDVLDVEVVDEAEWDAYEDSYAGAIEGWAVANTSDPEAESFLARAQLFRASYAEWRRDGFGFAVARFRVPG